MLGEGGAGLRLVGTNSGASGLRMYVFFSSTSSSCVRRSAHVVPCRLPFSAQISMKRSHNLLKIAQVKLAQ